MRFDDRLTTVLKGPLPEGLAAAMQWRQVVDIMSQKPGNLMSEHVQQGLTRLRDLHDRVNESDRLAAVQSLSGRLRSAPLLVYLTADTPEICHAAIAAADLPAEDWADIRPQLSDRAKDVLVLQAQQEIEPTVEEEGEQKPETASDHKRRSETQSRDQEKVLAAEPEAGETEEQSQISDLVAKIADYQSARNTDTPQLPLEDSSHRSFFVDNVDEINFETDDSGTVIWVEGPPTGSVVGVTISEPAYDEGPGPDAYGAAAFRQRMPLENARMRLCGAPVVAGDWRMTAIPYFADDTGRFRGYRGIMRRPNAAEDAGHASIDIQRREQLQQLIHELRTPLNAIIGFSEIIDQQLFGPASFEYRALSRSIIDEARRLLSGFEDLDVAAKFDAGQIDGSDGITDTDWLLEKLAQRLHSLTQSKSVDLHISKAEPVRSFALENETVERIFARFLSSAIIACEKGEELTADLRTRIGPQPMNQFTLSRPSRIKNVAEDQLLDPSQGIDGDSSESPLLGLGFSLRLVGNLARNASGALDITEDKITLTLPAVTTSEIGVRETENE